MPDGQFQVPLPANATVRVSGFANTGGWIEQITITSPDSGPQYVWSNNNTGGSNMLIGQALIGPYTTPEKMLTVQMDYDAGDGLGLRPCDVKVDSFNMDGLSGYVVGGQDGGGRKPDEPAYWNTVAFIYWAEGY